MLHTKQWDGIKPGTTITADETVTGPWLDLESVQGSLSITIIDENGNSTSQDITYQKGICPYDENIKTGSYQELADKLIAVTPADGGTIGSNVDCNAATNNAVADTLTLPDGRWFRFKILNDTGMADAKDSLYIEGQV